MKTAMEDQFYEHILNELMEPVCVLSTSGAVLYHNEAFASCFSLSASAVGTLFSDLPAAYRDVSCHADCFLQGRKIKRKKAGMTVYAVPLHDQAGRIKACAEEILTAPGDKEGDGMAAAPSEELILSDAAMQDINLTIQRTAYFDSTILIQGETGTGKSVLAKHIHHSSNRASKPFITINCGAIPENLIESELFGYASGTFTSASKKGKPGQVELAANGTLFLDEIGLLPYPLQSKLLHLIQEKTYTPVGALKSKTVDVRIIAATNENLKQHVAEHKFREDLYYRLRVIELFLPPLRERPDAMEPLIHFFLQKYNAKFGTHRSITATAVSALKDYDWPGNIRELQYVIERIVLTTGSDTITSEDIPPLHNTAETQEPAEDAPIIVAAETDFDTAVAAFEKELLTRAYKEHPSSYKVAEALGITQTKASRLLRKYSISKTRAR